MNIEKIVQVGLCTAAAAFGGGMAIHGMHEQSIQDYKLDHCDINGTVEQYTECLPSYEDIDKAGLEVSIGSLLVPLSVGVGLLASSRNLERKLP